VDGTKHLRRFAAVFCVLLLFFALPPLSFAQENKYPWEKALETQLSQLTKPQDVYVVHLGISDRDEEAYSVAQNLSQALGRPVIALPSYSGNPAQDLPRAVIQYFDSRTYPVHFDQAWERIVSREHRIVGTVFHSGAGIRANTERDSLITFIRSHPGKVTGNMVFVTTDLKGLTTKDFARVGIQCVQVGMEDLVSWATKPAARYVPFGEYLGPPATALGWALKSTDVVGKGLSKHALLTRQDEIGQALQGSPSVASPLLPAGGIDLTAVEMRYLSEYRAGPLYVLSAALHGTPAEPGRGIDRERASALVWNSLYVWLALPNNVFWVNLNPSEPNRIIDSEFGKTDAGRILLDADFQMKKTVASLLHPDSPTGQAFWDQLYHFIEAKGQTKLCFSFRQWIVPRDVTVWDNTDSIYIVNASLDVKLESEYLKLKGAESVAGAACPADVDPSLQVYAEDLFRKMILPELTEQVNTAPEYLDLRSIFYSRIVAEWYKTNHRASGQAFGNLIGRGYASEWYSNPPWNPRDLFNRYLESITKGEFNLARQTQTVEGDYVITRTQTYFYGGVDFSKIAMNEISYEELLRRNPAVGNELFDALLTPTGQWGNDRWIGGTYVAGIPEEVSLTNMLQQAVQELRIKGYERLLRRRI